MIQNYLILFNFETFVYILFRLSFLQHVITNCLDFFILLLEKIFKEILVVWANHDVQIVWVQLVHIVYLLYEIISVRTHVFIVVI